MFNRIKQALKFNEVQTKAVALLTAFNVVAILTTLRTIPWWAIIVLILLYPAIAFVANLVDPKISNH